MAEAMGARRLLDISGAHIDGCLYHGQAGLDFALRLAEGDAKAQVPTTLNVSSLDLLHPHLYRGDADRGLQARRLMDTYLAMGCEPTWTCAPYQLQQRPGLGAQVAWGESNAVVFANSVLGARTNRYGDFLDICCAVTGRAPAWGLHLDRPRRATVIFELVGIPDAIYADETFFPVLGHLMGMASGLEVAAIVGLPPGVSEDQLKVLGAAAASSGSVGMFHAVGITPEAPTLDAATQGGIPRVVRVRPADLRAARHELSTVEGGRVDAVCLGTPHASLGELERIVEVFEIWSPKVPVFVNTGRNIFWEASARGWAALLEEAGVQLVTDTCTYVTSILPPDVRVVMTNSAKWAYYAPGNLGVEVVLGNTVECARSANVGEIWRDGAVW
jgi:predicted aconitase